MLMNDKFNFAKVKVMKKGTHEWLLLSPPSNLGMVYRAGVGRGGGGGKAAVDYLYDPKSK